MAQKTMIVCDLDENDAAATTRLGYGNVQYRLDLCEAHHLELDDYLSRFLDVAARDNSSNGHAKPRAVRNPQTQAIREWARSNGIPVPDRGRIPGAVAELYTAAH